MDVEVAPWQAALFCPAFLLIAAGSPQTDVDVPGAQALTSTLGVARQRERERRTDHLGMGADGRLPQPEQARARNLLDVRELQCPRQRSPLPSHDLSAPIPSMYPQSPGKGRP